KFSVKNNGSNIGYGEKTMALSGLRPYDQDTVDTMVADYMASKQDYARPGA
ncbi:hypothetical protein MNBD_GAMMA13-558, partial [hydrothermal vent metagenome]